MTDPVLVLRAGATLPAPRWESHVDISSPTNWRVEPLPPFPQGIGTVARAGLPGKPGHLFVRLPGPPKGWKLEGNLESELRTHLLLSETHRPDFHFDLLPLGLDLSAHIMGELPSLGMMKI